MEFFTYCDDYFCQETVVAGEAARTTSPRRRPRERRLALASSPTPAAPQMFSKYELHEVLLPYLLTPKRMWELGYPLEIAPNSSKAVVYANPPPRPYRQSTFDVNAPVFIPGSSQNDSGRGSWGSSPRSESDEEADAVEHTCVRCDKLFRVTKDGEYVGQRACVYHWGRISPECRHTCCNAPMGSRGCSVARFHVWGGTKPGMNGPLEGYVRARTRRGGVYAIDTEMCYTTAGLELASIVVIEQTGRVVYKSIVKPSSQILDHNTRFSGIRPRDLARATKTLKDVQNDILGFIGTDTIIVGHALENDLRALKLLHGAVVDTCVLYPHSRGFPLRRSLRSLCEEILGRSVQQSSTGHSPVEDARAAMDLVLMKLEFDRARAISMLNVAVPVFLPYATIVKSD